MTEYPSRMGKMRAVHECVGCPHLASSHRLVPGAPIEGPYRCVQCGHEMNRGDATRLITVADMHRLHAEELPRV